jgi:hypothetical protein
MRWAGWYDNTGGRTGDSPKQLATGRTDDGDRNEWPTARPSFRRRGWDRSVGALDRGSSSPLGAGPRAALVTTGTFWRAFQQTAASAGRARPSRGRPSRPGPARTDAAPAGPTRPSPILACLTTAPCWKQSAWRCRSRRSGAESIAESYRSCGPGSQGGAAQARRADAQAALGGGDWAAGIPRRPVSRVRTRRKNAVACRPSQQQQCAIAR